MGRAGGENWTPFVAAAINAASSVAAGKSPEANTQPKRRPSGSRSASLAQNEPMLWTRAGVRLIPERHSPNRSLSATEPVSAPAKRKLENGEQRPAPETLPARDEIPKITGRRLASANVTRGNVEDFPTPGNITPETRLPGCPERIRTLDSRDARPAPGAPPCRWNRSEIRMQGSTPPGPGANRGDRCAIRIRAHSWREITGNFTKIGPFCKKLHISRHELFKPKGRGLKAPMCFP